MNKENYDSGFSGYETLAYEAPVYNPPSGGGDGEYFPLPFVPYSPPPQDTGGGDGEYFPLPYVSPQTGQPVLSTGLYLAPGQSYKPGGGVDRRQAFTSYGNYVPTFSRGGYPSAGRSDVSYIGPTVSARPAFNVRMRGLKVRDLFKRWRRE